MAGNVAKLTRKPINIYILELADGMFYVGKTTKDPQVRFEEHQRGEGSEWTRRHKPIRIIESFAGDNDDENKYTLMYMREKGLFKVRGGAFSRPKLTKADAEIINRLNNSTTDRCFICGDAGHWATKCPRKKSMHQQPVELANIEEESPHDTVILYDKPLPPIPQQSSDHPIVVYLEKLSPEYRCAVSVVVIVLILGMIMSCLLIYRK